MSSHWRHVLNDVWGIDAQLTQLDGEYDLNFLARGGRSVIVKVMRVGCAQELVDLQCQAFSHIKNHAAAFPVPEVIPNLQGELLSNVEDELGQLRIVWVLECLPGIPYADFKPHSDHLIRELGACVGNIDHALQDFQHPGLERSFKWNLCEANWIAEHSEAIKEGDRRALINEIVEEFLAIKACLKELPQVAIHNDVNDYNIIVSGSISSSARISGLIDLGDMCASPRICDLAITAAYVVLGHSNPVKAITELLAGYHQCHPLTRSEIDLIWPLLRMRLAVSVVNSTLMSLRNPDDPYVVISQGPAWDFLQAYATKPALLEAQLRIACGFPPCASAPAINDWLRSECGNFKPILDKNLSEADMTSLGVDSCLIPQNPFNFTAEEAMNIGQATKSADGFSLGYYAEPRLIYTSDAFQLGPWRASKRRTVHLGIDVFAPIGTAISAPCTASVSAVGYREENLDYGGYVVLKHFTSEGDEFYSFYGHLDPKSCESLVVGAPIIAGEPFAALGDANHNGGWDPHLHLQLAYTLTGLNDDWPGVAEPDELTFWAAYCPNPAALLNLSEGETSYPILDKEAVKKSRRTHFGKNVSLSYADPSMFVRGWKHHLFDEWGRAYLDAYNNVPHVGHAHPRIQQVAADQLKRLNSNTRYLHPAQSAFAEKIISKLPAALSVCYLVNSGSEANELALRLARAHTSGKDMVTPDHGYHGNTTGAIDISAYKFNAPGGVGNADWVHLVEVADDYRGRYRRDDEDRAIKYAKQVDTAIEAIRARGVGLAGFIAETFPSVGGQVIPPAGYLSAVYERVRAAGGVCIADEVQTGLGRLGEYYFGFEQQEVVPDIVVLGKPIANGHPVGVVITTQKIADSFALGPEYFSTFGGSTLSCLLAKEVLDIVDDESLMQNAAAMGAELLEGLKNLQQRYSCIGDVRGFGLFVGVDLVVDPQSREPATELANFVKNRLHQNRILIGCEGPADNILKIRPPLTIQSDDVKMLLAVLDQVLAEAQKLDQLSQAETR